ncbi:MAG TPA: hypothetical protein IGS37_10135 [Synechococcales cyanobacterium M55_K2018_004]|nr:hypothetical protein [Synechococcales cyanobacterium M55_K2018_004]
MSTLQPIQIDDHTVIYIEAAAAPEAIAPSPNGAFRTGEPEEEEQTRTAKGILPSPRPPERNIMQVGAQNLENTIRYYTAYMLNAFKQVAISEVKRVTLEFGVNMSGMTGIPYIASGTAGCNVKVTVECSFEAVSVRKERE